VCRHERRRLQRARAERLRGLLGARQRAGHPVHRRRRMPGDLRVLGHERRDLRRACAELLWWLCGGGGQHGGPVHG
jgi:hypothetical protein